jgi:outer membrane protein assembly factor BamB
MNARKCGRAGGASRWGARSALAAVLLFVGACTDQPQGEASDRGTDPTSSTTSAPRPAADDSAVDAGTTSTSIPLTPTELASSSTLAARDARTGEERWRVSVPAAQIGAPVSGGSTVAVLGFDDCSTSRAELIALDAGSGRAQWQTSLAPWVECHWDLLMASTSEVLAGVVPSAPAHVVGFDLATGTERWDVEAPGASQLLATEDAFVVVRQDQPGLRLLDDATGALRWEASPEIQVAFASVSAGHVVAYGQRTAEPGTTGIVGVDLATGAPAWELTLGVGSSFPRLSSGGVVGVVLSNIDAVQDPGGVITVHDAAIGDVLWRDEFDAAPASISGAADVLVIDHSSATSREVRAYAERTGEPVWSRQYVGESPSVVFGPPGAEVVAISLWRDGVASATEVLDAGTGDVLWSVAETSYASVAGDAVYFRGDAAPALLVAGDPSTGVRRWAVAVTDDVQAFTGIVAADGVVYGQASDCGYPGEAAVVAFDGHTGEQLLHVPMRTGAAPWIMAPHSVEGGVYVAVGVSAVVGIDVADGSFRWELPAPSSSTAIDGRSIVTAEADALVAYDRQSGEPRWRTDIGPGTSLLGVARAGDLAVAWIGSEVGERLEAFDLDTGAPAWRFDGSFVVVAASDDVIAISDTSGSFVGIDAATGAEVWRGEERRAYAIGSVALAPSAYLGAFGPDYAGPSQIVDVATGATVWTYGGDPALPVDVHPHGVLAREVDDAGAPVLAVYGPPDGARVGAVPVLPTERGRFTTTAIGPDGVVYQGRGCPMGS